MQIKNIAELQAAIDSLKQQEKFQKELMVENFHNTYESFKPLNLIKKAVGKLIHSPQVTGNVVKATVGLGAGLLTKKLIIGRSGNIFKKMLGRMLQVTVAGAITKNSDAIKLKGAKLLSNLFKSKKREQSF